MDALHGEVSSSNAKHAGRLWALSPTIKTVIWHQGLKVNFLLWVWPSNALYWPSSVTVWSLLELASRSQLGSNTCWKEGSLPCPLLNLNVYFGTFQLMTLALVISVFNLLEGWDPAEKHTHNQNPCLHQLHTGCMFFIHFCIFLYSLGLHLCPCLQATKYWL